MSEYTLIVYFFCLILAKYGDFLLKMLDRFLKVWYDTKLNIFTLTKGFTLLDVEIFKRRIFPLKDLYLSSPFFGLGVKNGGIWM